jgi:hypothetical protein
MNNVLPGFISSLPEKEERRAAHPHGPLRHARRGGRADRLPGVGQVSYMTGQNLRVDGGLTRSL